tara:strand:- start:64 stop:1038 length:975 start_codon:yes stop_codon:yes gene_type:complete
MIDMQTSTTGLFTGAPADSISLALSNIGLTEQRRDSAKTVSVYVPLVDRINVMQHITDTLPGAVWDKNFSNSSVGAIRYCDGTIRVRPKGNAGANSAGLGNEQTFVNEISKAIKTACQPISIAFVGSNGVGWDLHGVTSCTGVGADTSGRKKADVIIHTDSGLKRISLKKGNAEYWESADTYFGHEADSIITELVAADELSLIPLDKTNSAGGEFVKLSREVAADATADEVIDIVFGNDLTGPDGAILKQTFSPDDFQLDHTSLTVRCSVVIVDVMDIPEQMYPYFLIRNDSSRGRPKYMYPGIRATAIYKKRINKTTIRYNRH